MKDTININKNKNATLGGGCFWCMQAVFSLVKGVVSTVAGYSGGSVSNPLYEEVCTGKTGHAEVLQITYNPKLISYRELLEIFFSIHDPTTLNRQGDDIGTQYRSIIFYHDEEQKLISEEMISEIERSGRYTNPVVTEIVSANPFYKAEDYHQNYFRNNPDEPYCKIVISPKVEKFIHGYIVALDKNDIIDNK